MLSTPPTSNTFRSNLSFLYGESLKVIAFVVGIIGYLWIWLDIWPITGKSLPLSSWIGASSLLVGVFLSYRFLKRWTYLATYVLIFSLFIAVSCAVFTFRDPAVIYLFTLPIIFASVLLSQRGVFIIAVLTVVIILLINETDFSRNVLPIIPPIGVIVCLTTGSWLAARNLRITLAWFIEAYTQASDNERIARDHEAELRRALKIVDDMAYRLERLNYSLRQERNQAEEARRVKQQFAQTISHELRTPLNIIVAFSGLMAQSPDYYDAPLPPAYLRDLSIIHRNASHLQSLVNDVLDLAKIEAAQMVIVPEECDPTVLAQDAAQTIRSMVELCGIKLNVDIAENLPTLWVDSTRIRQVLFNLLNNATRFTEKGSITLRVRQEEEAVVFSIIDTGVGIAPQDIPQLFVEFHQLSTGARRQYSGAGLGLAISRHFVELHHGQIWVESELGIGSTFSFKLPILAKQSAFATGERPEWEQLPSLPPDPERDFRLVLVITSSPSAAALLSRHLQRCRLIVLQDLAEAGETARRIMPHAILIDSAHEDISPNQLQEFTLSLGLQGIVVMICPMPGEAMMKQSLQVNGFMVKPVTAQAIFDVIRTLDRDIGRILVVDDNHDFVLMLTRLLNDPLHHYTVIGAYSAQEGLSLIDYHRPDLILLDLQLPDMSGIQLIERVRANPLFKSIPIIVISGEATVDLKDVKQGPFILMRGDGIAPNHALQLIQSALDAQIKMVD